MSTLASNDPNLCGYKDVICKVMAAFIALSSYLIFQQMDVTSRHYAACFNIPLHNIGIYFDKLFSLRVLLILVGNMIEYGIFQGAGADYDPEDKNKGKRVRRYVSITAFCLLLIVRVMFLGILYFSSQLGYHVYVILSFEGLPFGIHDSAFMALIAQYMSVVAIIFNMTRIFIFLVQFVLDRLWYNNPLLMIKIHAWICVIFTTTSVILWYRFNFIIKAHNFLTPEEIKEKHDKEKLEEQAKKEHDEKHKHTEQEPAKAILDHVIDAIKPKKEEPPKSTAPVCPNQLCVECRKRVGNDGVGTLLSPLMMYWMVNPYMVFLFPGTVPYGLLKRDRCHMINMLIPIFDNVGPLVIFFMDNFGQIFPCWSWHYDLFLFLAIPYPIIFIFALMAMHSRIPMARKIISNRPRIATMTLTMYFSNSFLTPLHYIGMAKYSFRGNPYGFTIQGIQKVIGAIFRSFVAKTSVGYTVTRISLGYHLPKFRPTHRMSKKNVAWYIFRQTFKRTLADFKGDLRLDMKKYL